MASTNQTTPVKKNPKKANLLDHNSLKNLLDESVTEIVTSKGYKEDVRLSNIRYKFKFQIPSYFSLVIRSLAVLEGIAIGINPEYKVLCSTYPWIARKVLTDSSPKLKASLRALLYKDGKFRIDRLESLLSESLRAKTDETLIKKPNGGTDSKVVVKRILSFTLDDKGAFIREILLEEFAKFTGYGCAWCCNSQFSDRCSCNLFFLIGKSKMDTKNGHEHAPDLPCELTMQEKEVNGASTSNEQRISLNGASIALQQFVAVQELLPLFSILPEVATDEFD